MLSTKQSLHFLMIFCVHFINRSLFNSFSLFQVATISSESLTSHRTMSSSTNNDHHQYLLNLSAVYKQTSSSAVDQESWIKKAESNSNHKLDQWPQAVQELTQLEDVTHTAVQVNAQLDDFKRWTSDASDDLHKFIPRLK